MNPDQHQPNPPPSPPGDFMGQGVTTATAPKRAARCPGPWLVLLLAACWSLFFAWGCHEDSSLEEDNQNSTGHTPLVITKDMRAVAWDFGDAQNFATGVTTVPAATIKEELPAVILRRQLYDEIGESINTGNDPGPYDFTTRILALKDQVEDFLGKGITYDVHLDLQTMNRAGLSGPGLTAGISDNGYSFAARTNGGETEYRTGMVEAVTTVAKKVKPRRFIIGTAMNIYGATPQGEEDWGEFVEFFITQLKPAIKGASPKTLVSVGLYWDDMVIRSNLEADQLYDPEAAPTGDGSSGSTGEQDRYTCLAEVRAKTDRDLFHSLMGGLMDHVDEVALSTSPTSSRLNELEEDHYRRLLPLVGEEKPIVFMEVWSPHTSAEVDYPAVWLLEKFKDLAGELPVAQVAWSRIRDIPGADRCAKIMANLDVPINLRFCNAGLFNSGGTHKASLWSAYLGTPLPGEE